MAFKTQAQKTATHFTNSADVLVPVLLAEAKVLVQAESDVVTVESESSLAHLEQGSLEGHTDGGLARCCVGWLSARVDAGRGSDVEPTRETAMIRYTKLKMEDDERQQSTRLTHVSQMVAPFWPVSFWRSSSETVDALHSTQL